jgi:hypothetical protein
MFSLYNYVIDYNRLIKLINIIFAAIKLDGCDVINWASGYSQRFGLFPRRLYEPGQTLNCKIVGQLKHTRK